jgi:hypothetical protein
MLAAAAAAVVVATASTGASASSDASASTGTTASSGTTYVDPGALQRGPDPRVPYLRTDTDVIHDGARRVHVRFPGRVSSFATVRGGYLIGGQTRTRSWLAVYDHDGHRRELAHAGVLSVLVAPGGRRVAYTTSDPQTIMRVVVQRVSDGRVLTRHDFLRPGTSPVAFGAGRLLLGQGFGHNRRTVWWVPGRRGLRTYSRTERALDADLSAGQAAMEYPRSSYRMQSIPPGTSWHLPGVGASPTIAWSPDDRRSLVAYQPPHATPGWLRLAVYSPAGRRLHTLDGRFSWLENRLRWEGPRVFLAAAYAPAPDGEMPRQGAIVRCWVGGRCERASAVYGVTDTDLALPFLLAAERTG